MSAGAASAWTDGSHPAAGAAGRHSPWLIAIGSTLALVVGNGPISVLSFGVFIKPIEQAVGWDRAHLSVAPALASFLSALCVPVMGALMDRWGVKRVLLPAICVYALNVAVIGFAGSFPLFVLLTALSGITGAAQGPVGYQKSIARFFDKHRGLATGVAMSGVGVGTAGIVVFVTCRVSVSGVGESVCARAPAPATRSSARAKKAAPGRGRRKECFTKNPPDGSILDR